MSKNSKIILSKNIQLDRDYKNVLNYTEDQMINLCSSQEHLVSSASNYSFIKTNKEILVNFTYSQCLQSNYIAFQNPSYSNKWFFAWIDEVEYKSESATRITFTIDAWSTWFSYWTPSQCFVIREHVNDDTIGKHTIPEGLEHGEYIINSMEYDQYNVSNPQDTNKVVYIVSSTLDISPAYKEGEQYQFSFGSLYGGVYSGNTYWGSRAVFGAPQKLLDVNRAGQIDAINGLFVAPKWVVGVLEGESEDPISGNVYQSNAPMSRDISINRNTSIGSSKFGFYTPKNNKLFTSEYNYLLVNNGAGGVAKYHWENFINNAQFKMIGVLCPGCSIKLIPNNYMDDILSDNMSLSLGKYPQLNWASDMYTNWLTQNAVNNAWDIGSSIGRDIIGLATSQTGNINLPTNTVNSLFNQMQSMRAHSFDAPQNRGNSNSGDISYSGGYNRFQFYKMTIKPEYAKCIDDYFTRYGYKINELKTPNITGRAHWNFIQINQADEIGSGSVPSMYMETINNVARAGTTIWHNHEEIGDYSLNNNII